MDNDIQELVAAVSRRVVAVSAIIGAVYLIATGHVNESGWGWLVLLAFLAA